MKLHMDCAKYYDICSQITTEDDLKLLFKSLAEERRKMTVALGDVLPKNIGREIGLLKDVLTYLQQAWYHMKVALISNNREQILKHSFKSEQAMLHTYEQVASDAGLPEELFRQGIHHQQILKENIRLISSVTTIKFTRQKQTKIPALQRA